MGYRFTRTDPSVEAGLRRIAGEEIDAALASLQAPKEARAAAVHAVRKRCKKLRGVLRIVRPSFAGYRQENAAFREISGLLGSLRDAKVLGDTFNALLAAAAAGESDGAEGDGAEGDGAESDRALALDALEPVRAALSHRREANLDEGDIDARFAEARVLLSAVRERARGWSLGDEGWDALGPGTAREYRRAREGMARAAKKPTAERHHDWRKGVKYHWYHARLLRALCPEQMKPRAAMAAELAELLGDHHDCHVLVQAIRADPAGFAPTATAKALVALARRRAALLEEQAHRLGAQLLADKPGPVERRWGEWWGAWQHEGDLHAAAPAE